VALRDQARHLVVVRRNQLLGQKRLQRHVGQRHLCRQPFDGAIGGEAREFIAGPLRGRLGHQLLQVGEPIDRLFDSSGVRHDST
jgi:hypothetical protein